MPVPTIDADSVRLAESLLFALRLSNEVDGLHAHQDGGTYGHVDKALEECLVIGFVGKDSLAVGQEQREAARKVARWVREEATDNGESIAYNLGLLPEYWCEACSEPHTGYCDARLEEQRRLEEEKCSHGFSRLSRCPVTDTYGCGDR